MSILQTQIHEMCPEGVQFVKLGDVAKCYSGATPSKAIKEYWEGGTIPWMNSGEVNLGRVYETENKITQLGFDSCSTKLVPPHTVVIALAGQGKTRGMVAITEIELCTNQSLCAIEVNERLDSYFLWHYLKGQYQTLRQISSGDGTRGGLNQEMIRNFEVPVPPMEVQKRIVKVLDNFSKLTEELTAELTAELRARQKQYEFYRDKLLSFNNINGGGYDIAINWIPLKMCCAINKGDYLTKKDAHVGTVPVILGGQQPAYYIDRANHSGDAIVVSRSGASAGFVSWWHEPIFVTDGFLIEPCESLRHRFVYHYLKSIQAQLNASKRGSGVPHITSEMLSNVPIPVIPLSLQDRITTLLDTLNELSTKLVQELHTEIQARQQQYEYYRDKLLTFKRKAVA